MTMYTTFALGKLSDSYQTADFESAVQWLNYYWELRNKGADEPWEGDKSAQEFHDKIDKAMRAQVYQY